jgi:hemoglobin-like flavoprotein
MSKFQSASVPLVQPAPPTPTSDPNELLRRSFAAVIREPERFGVAFYDRLFELAPRVRAMFPADMTGQRAKLVHAVAVLMRGLDQPDAMEPVLRSLGARHVGYKVEASHYAVVGEALVDTLDHFGPQRLCDGTRRAWNRLYGWIAATMLDGANDAERAAATIAEA